MARKNFVLETLEKNGEVTFKPHGNSMVPKIYSGDKVKIKSINIAKYRVGDAVYAKVKGSYYLHLLTAIDAGENKFQISNNHGHVNGWTDISKVFAVCTEVNDKIILSDEELNDRLLDPKGWAYKGTLPDVPQVIINNFKISKELQDVIDESNKYYSRPDVIFVKNNGDIDEINDSDLKENK